MRRFDLALAMLLATGILGAHGEPTVLTHLGVLTCSLAVASNAPDVNAVPGPLRQTREMLCAFKPGGDSPEETYSGTFQSIGQDQRDARSPVMIWNVKGTSSMLGTPGFLQQLYSIDAGAAPGRVTPLVGESNSSVMLEAMTEGGDQYGGAPMSISILVALRLKSTPA